MRDPLKTSGHWRASVRHGSDWVAFRGPTGPYADASLLEWGSITKGLVSTTAAILLDLSCPVRELLPEYPSATFTVGELVHHTSGLPRIPSSVGENPLGDAYRRTVGRPIPPADVSPVGPRGTYTYSNLGYALLGAVLDRTSGSWFTAAQEHVLAPAGITTATTDPEPSDRIVPRLWFGRTVRPWQMSGSPYAASGGVWSTFEDLIRYADWALAADSAPERRISWRREAATTWINGEVRAAGAAVVSAGGATAVVHTLAQAPYRADKIAVRLIEHALRSGTR